MQAIKKIVKWFIKKLPWWEAWLFLLTTMSAMTIVVWSKTPLSEFTLLDILAAGLLFYCTLDQWCQNVWRRRKLTLHLIHNHKINLEKWETITIADEKEHGITK